MSPNLILGLNSIINCLNLHLATQKKKKKKKSFIVQVQLSLIANVQELWIIRLWYFQKMYSRNEIMKYHYQVVFDILFRYSAKEWHS